MSNTAFNFLSESFLFSESEDVLKEKSIKELESELDKYREHINGNMDTLDTECINTGDEGVVISDYRPIQNLPKIEEITKSAVYMHRYILDDPLYGHSFKNLAFINAERAMRELNPITEDDLKNELIEYINYMKALVGGVDHSVGYVKFYPLSSNPNTNKHGTIFFPKLTFKRDNPIMYSWMESRMNVFNWDAKKEDPITGPCQSLVTYFQNDETYPKYYSNYRVIYYSHQLQSDVMQNVVPSPEVFPIWVDGEMIKTARDRYENIAKKNEFKIKFGGIASATTEFENDFMSSVLDKKLGEEIDEKALQIVTSLDLPSLHGVPFDKAMEIRKYFSQDFEEFRTQLQNDLIALQSTTNSDEVRRFASELTHKYEREVQEIKEKIRIKFKLKHLDKIPSGVSIVTLLTAAEPILLTTSGIGVLYEAFKGFTGERKDAKKNTCFFLYKMQK